jgi:hypothetical protein
MCEDNDDYLSNWALAGATELIAAMILHRLVGGGQGIGDARLVKTAAV